MNFDEITGDNQVKHNPKWSCIPDHPCRILINLINHQNVNHDKVIFRIYL